MLICPSPCTHTHIQPHTFSYTSPSESRPALPNTHTHIHTHTAQALLSMHTLLSIHSTRTSIPAHTLLRAQLQNTPSGAPTHPNLPSSDPPTRAITYAPAPGEKLDPRAAIAGRPSPAHNAQHPGADGHGKVSGGRAGVGAWMVGCRLTRTHTSLCCRLMYRLCAGSCTPIPYCVLQPGAYAYLCRLESCVVDLCV